MKAEYDHKAAAGISVEKKDGGQWLGLCHTPVKSSVPQFPSEPPMPTHFFCRQRSSHCHSLALAGTEPRVMARCHRDGKGLLSVQHLSSCWSVMPVSQDTPWILTSSSPDVLPDLWPLESLLITNLMPHPSSGFLRIRPLCLVLVCQEKR